MTNPQTTKLYEAALPGALCVGCLWSSFIMADVEPNRLGLSLACCTGFYFLHTIREWANGR